MSSQKLYGYETIEFSIKEFVVHCNERKLGNSFRDEVKKIYDLWVDKGTNSILIYWQIKSTGEGDFYKYSPVVKTKSAFLNLDEKFLDKVSSQKYWNGYISENNKDDLIASITRVKKSISIKSIMEIGY